ncbi:MAG: archease, partial [Candidatus Aminicenantes bacterium]|nr:archease [Candidatus Aminicenantes bacterium]
WAKIEPRIAIPVDIRARDHEQLLVGFLSEVVFLFDARRFLLGRVDGLEIEEATPIRDPQGSTDTPGALLVDAASRFRLTARFLGDAFSEQTAIHGAVKAVTYSEMKIERCAPGAGTVVQVVVDM